MTQQPPPLTLMSCRHCLRPVRLAGVVDDLEIAALRDHLRGCATPELVRPLYAEDVVQHYRMVSQSLDGR